jgi:hypothetical protein
MAKPLHAVFPPCHRDRARAFIDALTEAGRLEGERPARILKHFLEMSFRALRGATMPPNSAAWRANEDAFEHAAGRLRQRAAVTRLFSKMIAEVAQALVADPTDFLGPLFMELSAGGELGQFFTPPEVSRLIAAVALADARQKIKDAPDRRISLSEPTCGVGGMILAATSVLREMQVDVQRDIIWTAVEIDHRAMCAAYIQCFYSGIPAHIVWGNCLDDDERLVSSTPAALLQDFSVRLERALTPA